MKEGQELKEQRSLGAPSEQRSDMRCEEDNECSNFRLTQRLFEVMQGEKSRKEAVEDHGEYGFLITCVYFHCDSLVFTLPSLAWHFSQLVSDSVFLPMGGISRLRIF